MKNKTVVGAAAFASYFNCAVVEVEAAEVEAKVDGITAVLSQMRFS